MLLQAGVELLIMPKRVRAVGGLEGLKLMKQFVQPVVVVSVMVVDASDKRIAALKLYGKYIFALNRSGLTPRCPRMRLSVPSPMAVHKGEPTEGEPLPVFARA